jgi:hypothetical protein
MSDARTSQRHSLCNRSLKFGCPAVRGGIIESGLPVLQNDAVGAQRVEVRQGENTVICCLSCGGGGGGGRAEPDLEI